MNIIVDETKECPFLLEQFDQYSGEEYEPICQALTRDPEKPEWCCGIDCHDCRDGQKEVTR